MFQPQKKLTNKVSRTCKRAATLALEIGTMKLIAGILALTLLFGCSSNTVKFVDPDGKPIRGVIVLSEQPGYIFTPWVVSMNSSDKNGTAESTSSPFTYVYKSGFYPIVQGSDLTGVLFPRKKLEKGQSVHLLLNDPYYPNWFGRQLVTDRVTLYPLVPSSNIPYKIQATQYTIHEGKLLDLPVAQCPSIKISYNPKDSLFFASSTDNGVVLSKRFFFEGAIKDKGKKFNYSNKGAIYFYCVNTESKKYKIGFGVNHKQASGGNWNHTIIMLSAKVTDYDQIIYPNEKEIHPIFMRAPFVFDKGPRLVTNMNYDTARRRLLENMPQRTPNEEKFIEEWLEVFRKSGANNQVNKDASR